MANDPNARHAYAVAQLQKGYCDSPEYQQMMLKLGEISEMISATRADMYNPVIMQFNRDRGRLLCKPLRKVKPSDGTELALQLGWLLPEDRRQEIQHLQQARVGDLPPRFKTCLTETTEDDIYEYIIFYNNDFEIDLGDNLQQRISKLFLFLTGD